MNSKLLGNIRFYFAQSVFMTNCHFNACGRLNRAKEKNSKIVLYLSSSTIFLLVFQVIGLEWQIASLIKIVSFIGLLATGISSVFELMNKEDISFLICQHKLYAEKYKSLRDEYMSLIEEIMSASSDDHIIRAKRDELQKKYSSIGENAPSTTYEDYQNAQKNLGTNVSTNEEFSWDDKEIDKFLPKELRLN